MARDLQVPLCVTVAVVVPNITVPQKMAIYKVLRRVVCSAPLRAWEQQAYVRCTNSIQYLTGRLALPIWRQNGQNVSATCLLVCFTTWVKLWPPVAICSLCRCASGGRGGWGIAPQRSSPHQWFASAGDGAQRNSSVGTANWRQDAGLDFGTPHILVSTSLFPETGKDLQHIHSLARAGSGIVYVRIVDKGAGQIWGSCGAWVWNTITEFLLIEGYTGTSLSFGAMLGTLLDAIIGKGWRSN